MARGKLRATNVFNQKGIMANIKTALTTRQDKAELVEFQCDESDIATSSAAALDQGKYQGVVVKNGTGDYTITLNNASRRTITVNCLIPLTANLSAQIVSVSTTAVNFKFTNNSGTAVDTDFHAGFIRYDSAQER